MYTSTMPKQNRYAAQGHKQAKGVTVERLTEEQSQEVLEFLGARPVHTFGLVGFIRDNGLTSPHNRGTFYACRNESGELEGVALIGHATLFEARSEEAIAAFARLAQNCADVYMLMGEQTDAQVFWRYYSESGRPARLYCRELLFSQSWPVEVREAVSGLRLATPDDLDLIVPVHAETVVEESGINPLETDAEGFRKRCARRIEKGKTWVWVEDRKLMFKCDVVSESPDVIYLEGVWVHSDERGKGYATRCLSQLIRDFLLRTRSVCVLVNERKPSAQALYKRIGCKLIDYYDTIFLQQAE